MNSVFIVHSRLRLALPSYLFPSNFLTNAVCIYHVPMRATFFAYLILLHFITLIIISGEAYKFEASHYAVFSKSTLHPPSLVQKFSLAPWSQIPSIYVLPLVWPIFTTIRVCIQKFPDWPPGARTANGKALCHYLQFYRYFMSQFSDFCRHNPKMLLLNECLLL